MKSFSKMLCFIFLPAAALLSCQMIEDSVSASDELASEMVNIDFVTTEGHTVLGDVIDIPYSIENLLKAYENLPVQTKSQIDLEDIQPTHYYVRFYPKSIEEQDILRNIKPYVFLSETPLDREVVVGGSSYHDPSIPEDLPTFQYTVVPVSRWAEFAEYILTSLEYSSLGINPNNIVDTRQYWTRYVYSVEYSPFFIDFYDSFNQYSSGYSYLYDDITGFSSNQINQVVLLSFTLSDAKEYLKMMKPAYISDNQIDSYYNNYVGL